MPRALGRAPPRAPPRRCSLRAAACRRSPAPAPAAAAAGSAFIDTRTLKPYCTSRSRVVLPLGVELDPVGAELGASCREQALARDDLGAAALEAPDALVAGPALAHDVRVERGPVVKPRAPMRSTLARLPVSGATFTSSALTSMRAVAAAERGIGRRRWRCSARLAWPVALAQRRAAPSEARRSGCAVSVLARRRLAVARDRSTCAVGREAGPAQVTGSPSR